MFAVKKLIKINEHHLAETQKIILAHKESHDLENPRDFICMYLNEIKEQEKIIENTSFTGTFKVFYSSFSREDHINI